MTYKELLKNYRTKKVFIYGRSVIQIVDMETREEEGDLGDWCKLLGNRCP